ncbi:hypothetical protein [Schinkia azotoformans]|uniref:hypothetical protein n=1 Tax=Schinkia azotoformans TaxID=1454 RepID=UPI002DB7D847|nr:hypothetical protein [Schinkia azotoformans]MEC1717801.1 hypothetical protein [Schinkia azotoformans]MEC1743567.1 hypothetical protein [Schinkia azotoformans]MEC1746559.1 hypothetical protein [Schinkia azotoformans]MEC1757797.1 hypothetical protein [Schinkia azotoformans]MEC1769308.1 hypothetical protein [Schinkia azotoformans]
MISKDGYYKKQLNYFQYLGRPIEPALASSNQFHYDMYHRGERGFLVTFCGESECFRAIDISKMEMEYGSLAKGVARFSSEQLRHMGLPLPHGIETSYAKILIGSYLLNSCMCYVEIEKKDGVKEGFYVTKNYNILEAVSDKLADTEKRKRIETFNTQFETSHTELSTGVFQVVKLINDMGGLRVSKGKVNIHNKKTFILPLYAIGNYLDKIGWFLGMHQVYLTYEANGEEKTVSTSLRPDILAQWMRTNDRNAIAKVIDSVINPFNFGQITIPDLFRPNGYVTLQATDIRDIKKVE